MAIKPAKKLEQLSRLGVTVALTAFAFAVGVGVGALAVTAQHARAASVPLFATELPVPAEIELTASREAWGAYGVAVGDETFKAQPEERTISSALRVESRGTGLVPGPLYSTAQTAGMVPGDRAPATVTFYYCAGAPVGDGGGFCGHAADGTPVQIGVAACDRSYLGQKFRVVGDPSGIVFRCADTGGGVFGQMRDMWFPTSGEAAGWIATVGHNVTIEVLD